MGEEQWKRRRGARFKARNQAVTILFEAELRDADPIRVIAEHAELAPTVDGDSEPIVTPVRDYTRTLVEGVAVCLDDLDEIIDRELAVRDWSLARIPVVDREILRVGVWEIVFGSADVPGPTAISQAVEISTMYAAERAGAYINAVLDAVLNDPDPRRLEEKAAQAARDAWEREAVERRKRRNAKRTHLRSLRRRLRPGARPHLVAEAGPGARAAYRRNLITRKQALREAGVTADRPLHGRGRT
ncbi:MAG: transcription antitermination factor NusB [Corynebacterium sp.]|nr:transcription antitermination factor NusB [Corynebacterium sp.]